MLEFEFLNPIVGERLDVSQTPDEVFSQLLLGPGFVYMPTKGQVFAPFDGEITMLFPTGHALAIRHQNGVEALIHVGLDSVNLKGQGFTKCVTLHQKVSMGDLLMTFDLELIKEKCHIATPVVFVQRRNFEVFVNEGKEFVKLS